MTGRWGRENGVREAVDGDVKLEYGGWVMGAGGGGGGGGGGGEGGGEGGGGSVDYH